MYTHQKGKVDPVLISRVKTINTGIKSAGGKRRYERMSFPLMDRITGGINASTLLSHLMFLTGRGKLDDGWIYKTAKEIEEELGLTQRMQEGCRRSLVERGLINQRRAGNNGRMHFRVNLDAVNAAFSELYPGEFPPLPDSTEEGNAQDGDATFGGACFDNTGEEESTNSGNGKSHVWPIGTGQSGDKDSTILNNIVNTSTTTLNQEDEAEVGDSFTDDEQLPSLSNQNHAKFESCKAGEMSQAETMYQAFCEAMGIGKGIPNEAKLRDMETLLGVGMTPEKLPLLIGWIEREWDATAKNMGEPRKGKLTTAALTKYHDRWHAEYAQERQQEEARQRKEAEREAREARWAQWDEEEREKVEAGLIALDALDVSGMEDLDLKELGYSLYNEYFAGHSDNNPFHSHMMVYMRLHDKREGIGSEG